MRHRKTEEVIAHVESRVDEEAQEIVAEVLRLLATGRPIRAREVLREALLDRAVSEDEAAAYLGLAQRTLQDQRQTGTGPEFFKVTGKAVRYTRRSLRLFRALASRRCTANVPLGPHLKKNTDTA
jgi:enoyl-CoA hydratase/carnithine racemase